MDLKHRVTQRWAAMGLAARMWWTGITAVGLAAVLVLAAATVVDASSHPGANASAVSSTPARALERLGYRGIDLEHRIGFGVGIDGRHGDERGLRRAERGLVGLEWRHRGGCTRLLQRQGDDRHGRRHGDGARAERAAHGGPAGGRQPARGTDRRPR